MTNKKTITVLGAGYVGLTTAALLSLSDYTVYVVEPNPERLKTIKAGKLFFFESGIDPIIEAGLKEGTFIPTDSYSESVPNSDMVFSCVGTPDNPDGSSNLTYVFSAAEETARHLRPGGTFVQKSTVPVGTGMQIKELFTQMNVDLHYVSNPEFLREGTAVYDTLFFDRVVAGGDTPEAVEEVLNVYRNLEKHRSAIADIANIQQNPRKGAYIATSLNSAELIKVTANAFLALKISFANSIAKLADSAQADVQEVMDAVGADERIGRAFLNAGRGYGGGCFPKDVSGLIASAEEYGVDLAIMKAAQETNESMVSYIIEKLQIAIGGELKGKTLAILGLSFKAGTSDTRKSPGIKLANALHELGATVHTYDPQAAEEAHHDLHSAVTQHDNLEAAARGADAIIIATGWSDILEYSPEEFGKLINNNPFIDAVNSYDKIAALNAGLNYIGIGR